MQVVTGVIRRSLAREHGKNGDMVASDVLPQVASALTTGFWEWELCIEFKGASAVGAEIEEEGFKIESSILV